MYKDSNSTYGKYLVIYLMKSGVCGDIISSDEIMTKSGLKYFLHWINDRRSNPCNQYIIAMFKKEENEFTQLQLPPNASSRVVSNKEWDRWLKEQEGEK